MRPVRFHARRSAAAFTLVEMLVVIGVVGVLLGLIVPTLASVRAQSQSTVCLNNLRQVYTALDSLRQQKQDLLPFAAPLPPPVTDLIEIPGLPERLQAIIPREAETWMCPADPSEDSEELGTSYVYIAGAFMIPLLGFLPLPQDPNDPPLPPLSPPALIDRAARLITHRYTAGYLRSIPVLADSDDYHTTGNRHPRNGVFIDGTARILHANDENVIPDSVSP